ncbi:hypothetical protein INN88_14375, partial [Staphylococcus aureus]|nr:hypothetical protein [Staphylococcus aureus]
ASYSRYVGAIQPPTILTEDHLALMASARAEDVEGSLLLGSVKRYMEQASKTVQDALSSVQESDIAVVARGWMENHLRSLIGYWTKFSVKFTGFWDSNPEDQPT